MRHSRNILLRNRCWTSGVLCLPDWQATNILRPVYGWGAKIPGATSLLQLNFVRRRLMYYGTCCMSRFWTQNLEAAC